MLTDFWVLGLQTTQLYILSTVKATVIQRRVAYIAKVAINILLMINFYDDWHAQFQLLN